MIDSKGVDSIGRGRGSDGKRGGAELRREPRRCCAVVVVLVVRTDREWRRGAGRCGDRMDAATAVRKIQAELRELKKSGEEGLRRPIPRTTAARSGFVQGLHDGTGRERDHFIISGWFPTCRNSCIFFGSRSRGRARKPARFCNSSKHAQRDTRTYQSERQFVQIQERVGEVWQAATGG